jgi:hypothetical protein
MNFQAGARFQAIFGLALRRSRRLQKRSYGAARGTGWKTSCVRLHEFPYPSFHCELGRELSLHAQVGSSC